MNAALNVFIIVYPTTIFFRVSTLLLFMHLFLKVVMWLLSFLK